MSETESPNPINPLKALREAVSAIYFADSSHYKSALWSVVRALSPSTALLLEKDEKKAYDKVTTLQSIADAALAVKGRRSGLATLESLTAQVQQLTQERDEADRRAGAAERRQASTSDSLFKLNHWRDKQKVMAGYPSNVSFDIVWAETLAKAQKFEAQIPLDLQQGLLVEGLQAMLDLYDKNTCTHEETHRGGVIWTVCSSCGQKWADDEGGFKPYQDPPKVAEVRTLLKHLRARS